MRFLMLDLSPRVPRLRLLPVALALLAWTLCQPTPSLAQVAPQVPDLPEPVLKTSPLLQEQIPSASRGALPTFISGERLFGRPDLETVIEGHAELRRADLVIKADRLDYDQPTDLARAQGHVRINRAGNVYEGPLVEIKLDAFEGFFNQPRYYFLKNDSHGEASKVDFIDDQRLVIHNATLTTCRRLPGPSWLPDWILRATTLRMDNEADVGTAEGAVLSFKGVPLLPIPSLSFPLSDQRKSGFLPPTLELDNVNGAVVSMPYYWNIAPNRDATLTPTLMSKRGLNVGTEFRYLEADYSGRVQLDVMPNDPLRDSSRWGLTYGHQTTLKNPLTQRLTDGGVALNLNLNRVSDDNYWRDFTRASTSLTQRLLSNDVNMSWSNGPFASSARAVKWQTLQDAAAPIAQPYDLTQLTTRYARGNVFGADVSVVADYSQFQTDALRSVQPNANGQRVFSLVQASHPWIAPAGFITPKVQLHAAHYQLDAPLSTGATSVGRVVPTFSLDSGLVFERDTQLFGTALRQTLEPRAFYVNTPFRDQNALPNYDSGANDFNFATIYTENAFVGNDRISDSNLLTLGVSTRFLNPATGAEVARFGVAQRLRFTDQNVTLPGGVPATDRLSDLLLGASTNWDPRWAFDTTVQYNPSTQQSVRSTIGARYNPSPYRTITAAYRFQRDVSEQMDVGWQWPLNDLWGDRGSSLGAGRGQGEGRWYSVGRLNYSLNERKLVDAVLGLEYDAGCWLGRAVLEQLQTSTTAANQRIMFQLEFVGFTRLGVSPLKSLKDNVPNYQYLREQTQPPSRFSNYE
jgi:LPS-assembly protein